LVSEPGETEGKEKGEGSLSILIVPREKWRTNRGSHRVGKGDVGLRKLWLGNTRREDTEPKMEVLTKQLQIAELAAARPEVSFTSLNHYLDMDWMKDAYRRTRRESAPGVDGKTMEEYGKELEAISRS